jgi:hypothetical protein
MPAGELMKAAAADAGDGKLAWWKDLLQASRR